MLLHKSGLVLPRTNSFSVFVQFCMKKRKDKKLTSLSVIVLYLLMSGQAGEYHHININNVALEMFQH